jgi:transposase-like protein
MTKRSPFRYFKTSPEIIRLAVMMYVRFPLSLRNVEDLLHERGIDVSHETVGSGGMDLARCLQPKSVASEQAGCGRTRTGDAT